MKLFRTLGSTVTLLSVIPCTIMANPKEKVQSFYDFLSNPGSESHAEAFLEVASENWESVGNFSGENKSRTVWAHEVLFVVVRGHMFCIVCRCESNGDLFETDTHFERWSDGNKVRFHPNCARPIAAIA